MESHCHWETMHGCVKRLHSATVESWASEYRQHGYSYQDPRTTYL